MIELKEPNSYIQERFEHFYKAQGNNLQEPQVVDILVQFLIEIQPMVKRQFAMETLALFLMFIDVINEHGHDFIHNEQEMDKKTIPRL